MRCSESGSEFLHESKCNHFIKSHAWLCTPVLLAFHVMLCNCGIICNLYKQTSRFLFGINLTFILQLKKDWDDGCLNMGLWGLGVDKRVSRLTKKLHILKCLSFIITGQTKFQFLMWHILKQLPYKQVK